MIYHSHSLSLTAAADLALANFDRSRSAKSRTSPGSFLRTKAILRCKSILRESIFSCFIKFSSDATLIFPLANRKLQFRYIRRNRQSESDRWTYLGRRLADPEATTGNLWNEKLDFISTIGELHQAVVEAFGTDGWIEFTRLYHESIGIWPRRKQSPVAEPVDTPTSPLPPLPAQAYPLEDGLHRALLEMLPKVAAFLLHMPRGLPWRYLESEGERAHRKLLESEGCWTG